jgi:hypothetical protein
MFKVPSKPFIFVNLMTPLQTWIYDFHGKSGLALFFHQLFVIASQGKMVDVMGFWSIASCDDASSLE